jgi:hypothetical protein
MPLSRKAMSSVRGIALAAANRIGLIGNWFIGPKPSTVRSLQPELLELAQVATLHLHGSTLRLERQVLVTDSPVLTLPCC